MKPLALAGLLLLVATSAVAQSAVAQTRVGQVTAYNGQTLRGVAEDRTSMGMLTRAQLPTLPAPIEQVRGSTLGVRLPDGRLAFLRGMDVQYRLDGVVCRPRSATERGQSESVTGTGAGSGSAQDCTRAAQ